MSDAETEAAMSENPGFRALHMSALHRVEDLRELAGPSYRLTLVARHTGHPDGSRDLVICDDSQAELVAAINQQFTCHAVIKP